MQRRHPAAFAMGRCCAVGDLEGRGRTAERRSHISPVLCMSALSMECPYHTSSGAPALRQESGEADMLLVSRRRRAEGNEGTIREGL